MSVFFLSVEWVRNVLRMLGKGEIQRRFLMPLTFILWILRDCRRRFSLSLERECETDFGWEACMGVFIFGFLCVVLFEKSIFFSEIECFLMCACGLFS